MLYGSATLTYVNSIQSNLALFVQYLPDELIDRGVQVDAVYTDFQKALNEVNHLILLQKMAALSLYLRLCDFLSRTHQIGSSSCDIEELYLHLFHVLLELRKGPILSTCSL